MQYKSIAFICAALVLTGCVSSLPASALDVDFELPTAFARTPEENALSDDAVVEMYEDNGISLYADLPETDFTTLVTEEIVTQALGIVENLGTIHPSWVFCVSIFPDAPNQFIIAYVSGTKYRYENEVLRYFGNVSMQSFWFEVLSDGRLSYKQMSRDYTDSLDEPLTSSQFQFDAVYFAYGTLDGYVYWFGQHSVPTRTALPYSSRTSAGVCLFVGSNVPNFQIPFVSGYGKYVRQQSQFKTPLDCFTGTSSGGGSSSGSGAVVSGTITGTDANGNTFEQNINVDVQYPDGWTADYGKFEEPTAGEPLDAELENTSNTFLSGVTDYLKIFLNIRGSIGFFWEAADRVFKALDIWTIILFALFMGVVTYLIKGV